MKSLTTQSLSHLKTMFITLKNNNNQNTN